MINKNIPINLGNALPNTILTAVSGDGSVSAVAIIKNSKITLVIDRKEGDFQVINTDVIYNNESLVLNLNDSGSILLVSNVIKFENGKKFGGVEVYEYDCKNKIWKRINSLNLISNYSNVNSYHSGYGYYAVLDKKGSALAIVENETSTIYLYKYTNVNFELVDIIALDQNYSLSSLETGDCLALISDSEFYISAANANNNLSETLHYVKHKDHKWNNKVICNYTLDYNSIDHDGEDSIIISHQNLYLVENVKTFKSGVDVYKCLVKGNLLYKFINKGSHIYGLSKNCNTGNIQIYDRIGNLIKDNNYNLKYTSVDVSRKSNVLVYATLVPKEHSIKLEYENLNLNNIKKEEVNKVDVEFNLDEIRNKFIEVVKEESLFFFLSNEKDFKETKDRVLNNIASTMQELVKDEKINLVVRYNKDSNGPLTLMVSNECGLIVNEMSLLFK